MHQQTKQQISTRYLGTYIIALIFIMVRTHLYDSKLNASYYVVCSKHIIKTYLKITKLEKASWLYLKNMKEE